MDTSQAVLSFDGYNVQKIEFEHFEVKEACQSKEIIIDNELTRSIRIKNNEEFMLVLDASITGKDSNGNVAFEIKAKVNGIFSCRDGDANGWVDNATAIIYPYLRSTITTVTVNAGMVPLILPTVNVIAMFRDDQADE